VSFKPLSRRQPPAKDRTPATPLRRNAAVAGIVVGAVGAVVCGFTPPSLFVLPVVFFVVTAVLVGIGWTARPQVWFALVLGLFVLAEALYGFGQYQHLQSLHG
jgi:hypothetical protein